MNQAWHLLILAAAPSELGSGLVLDRLGVAVLYADDVLREGGWNSNSVSANSASGELELARLAECS